jgi:hypothetical protein
MDADVVEIVETAPKVKRVPVVVEEYTDETTGHVMRRYETGVIYDMTLHRMHKSPDPEYRGIQTSEDATRLRQKHIDTTRNEIYKAIVRKSVESGFNYVDTPDAAVGAVAGELWALALNPKVKPRDRREIWESISRAGRLIADARTKDDDDPEPRQVLDVGALRATIDELIRAKQELSAAKRADNA